MEMNFRFNVNYEVKVKLTDRGIEILKRQHDDLNKKIKVHGGQGLGEYELKVDADGYASFQMWCLMERLGPYMNIGFDPPFNANIIICNGEPC
jgi:hypothetical protein